MPELTFLPDGHTYHLDGVEVPSVTSVLCAGGLTDPSWFTESAAWKGSAVHLACQLDDENDLSEDTLSPEIAPYLEAYRKFKLEMGFVPTEIEQKRHGVIHGMRFAGTPDRVGNFARFPGSYRVVLDLKSGAIQKECAIQLAAYSELTGCLNRVAVRLQPDANYAIKTFPIRERRSDLKQFASALSNFYWKKG